MKQKTSSAGSCIVPHLTALRWCGFCRLSPNYPDPKRAYIRKAHSLYRVWALSLPTMYFVQQCVYAYKVRADLERFSRVMFLLMVYISSISKQLVFFIDADRIDNLISAIDDPDFNENSPEAESLQLKCAVTSRRVQRIYSGTAVVTCTLWIIFPVFAFARGLPVEFFFWTVIDFSTLPRFLVVITYNYYVTTLVGYTNTTYDAFIGTILYQCKVQFTLLRKNLENLFERADQMHKESGEDYETCVIKLLVKCFIHYRKICKEVSQVQKVFGVALLIQFAVGGWVLGMAFYRMSSLSVRNMEFLSVVLFISCILVELFLYCYYGNEVAVESTYITEALYKSSWENVRRGSNVNNTRIRRTLLFMMVGAQPLKPLAGWVVAMSLETYLKILKASYSFYAVLRQTKQK